MSNRLTHTARIVGVGMTKLSKRSGLTGKYFSLSKKKIRITLPHEHVHVRSDGTHAKRFTKRVGTNGYHDVGFRWTDCCAVTLTSTFHGSTLHLENQKTRILCMMIDSNFPI